MTTIDFASRLHELLPGSQNAHGSFAPPTTMVKGKAEIRDSARTFSGPATPKDWERHLAGERGLGIIPLVGGWATWAMIDIDNPKSGPPISLSEVAQTFAAIDPRLITMRTKSGGAHILVRPEEPMAAPQLREICRTIVLRAGLPASTEIFPKQDSDTSGPSENANWIAMPYFGGDKGNQHAFTPDGRAMTVYAFVEAIESSALDKDALNALAGRLDPSSAEHREAARRLLTKLADEMAKTVENRNIALNKAAFQMGIWIEAGAIEQDTVEQELAVAATRSGLPASEIRELIPRAIAEGRRKGRRPTGTSASILNPAYPAVAARRIIREMYTDEHGHLTARRWRETFWEYDGCYRDAGDEPVRAKVWNFLDQQLEIGGSGQAMPFAANKTRVANVVEAMASQMQLPKQMEPPTWLGELEGMPPAEQLLAVANGLLHLPSGTLHPPTPAFFALSATSVGFDPDAPEPSRWLEFLDQTTEGDAEAVETIQEFFGYFLSPDTSQQKILLVNGPRRSGKGTIGRVATGLLGRDSCAAPTLASLATNFGLQPLIGKPLAIIADARIGSRADSVAIGERLLAISGEDSVTIDRKHKEAWTGKLPTRFMLMTTELPRLSDDSGGLAGRFIVVTLRKSFYGREDPNLTNALLRELPGILNWARVGYLRLGKRGHFLQPKSALDAIRDLEAMASPITAFIAEEAVMDAGGEARVEDVWHAWQHWCEKSGHNQPGTKQTFGVQLKAAYPEIRRAYRGTEPARYGVYVGLRLNQRWTGI